MKLCSELGAGTTIQIFICRRLRVQAAEWQGAAPDDAPRAPRSKTGEIVLVVEDDNSVRNYTVGSLRELGYAVLEAADAASALEILAQEPKIDLLFTDLGLPGGINGRSLAERAREGRAALKVLITTAYAGAALIHDGRLDPDVELLSKPFSFQALAAAFVRFSIATASQDRRIFLSWKMRAFAYACRRSSQGRGTSS